MSATTSGNCIVCGIMAKNFCSACESVRYCSAEHQKTHWKIHKNECRSFEISSSDELGRYLKAKRNIKRNQIIFTESPIVVGPKWYLNDLEVKDPIVPCVGCYEPCRIGVNLCPKCFWPACNSTCPGLENPKTHAFDCLLLRLGPGPKRIDDITTLLDYYRTDALIVLKCLMLQVRAPKKWKELMDMQSHENERIGSELYHDAEERIVSYLQTNFMERFKSLQEESQQIIMQKYDAKLMRQISGIIETNYMCIDLCSGLELSGIFYTACMMEHSCMPNCYFKFDQAKDFRVSVIAGRDINKGEHLKIMYTNMLWNTQMRRVHLEMTKHFVCKCDRCIDPTECGTFLSALKCLGRDEQTNCDGYQLPDDPLSDKIEWKCNKCSVIVNDNSINSVLSQMGEQVNDALISEPTINKLEDLIQKLSRFLHPNHCHLFTMKHSLIQLYGTEIKTTNLSENQLDEKMKMCQELLDVCDKIDPFTIRLTIYVAIILMEMQSVLHEKCKRKIAQNQCDDDNLLLAKSYLIKAKELLKKELDNGSGSGGMKLNDVIDKEIDKLNELMKTQLNVK